MEKLANLDLNRNNETDNEDDFVSSMLNKVSFNQQAFPPTNSKTIELTPEIFNAVVNYMKENLNKIPPDLVIAFGDKIMTEIANFSTISSQSEFLDYMNENENLFRLNNHLIEIIGLREGKRWVKEKTVVESVAETRDEERRIHDLGLIQRLKIASKEFLGTVFKIKSKTIGKLGQMYEAMFSRYITLERAHAKLLELHKDKKREMEAQKIKCELEIEKLKSEAEASYAKHIAQMEKEKAQNELEIIAAKKSHRKEMALLQEAFDEKIDERKKEAKNEIEKLENTAIELRVEVNSLKKELLTSTPNNEYTSLQKRFIHMTKARLRNLVSKERVFTKFDRYLPYDKAQIASKYLFKYLKIVETKLPQELDNMIAYAIDCINERNFDNFLMPLFKRECSVSELAELRDTQFDYMIDKYSSDQREVYASLTKEHTYKEQLQKIKDKIRDMELEKERVKRKNNKWFDPRL